MGTLFSHLFFIPNKFYSKILNRFFDVSHKRIILVFAIYYLIGSIFNKLDSFTDFAYYHFVFCFIALISVLIFHSTKKDIENINNQIIIDKIHIIDTWNRLSTSLANIVFPIVIGAYFGIMAMILVDIPLFSLTTLYMELTYVVCFICSFIGYLQFCYLKYISFRIYKSNKTNNYFKEYPAKTEWLISYTKLTNKYRNSFFFLGSIFLVSIYRFITLESFGVINKSNILQFNKVVLYLFSLNSIIAIAVIFPLLSLFEHYCISNYVDKLKLKTIKKLQNSSFPKKNIELSQLIVSIANTSDYPTNDTLGKLFSTISAALNFFVSVQSLSTFIEKLNI